MIFFTAKFSNKDIVEYSQTEKKEKIGGFMEMAMAMAMGKQ